MDILLLHSSDLHVTDDHPEGLSPAPRAGLDGLRCVIDAAQRVDAQILLLAGDTFDHQRVSAETLMRATALLAEAGRPVVMLPGNHDAALPQCLFRRAGILDLPHVAVLGITHEQAVQFPALGLEIWGHAHRGSDALDPLHPIRPRSTRWQVALVHGHYVPEAEADRQRHRAWKISDADLARCEADYVALGHWDRHCEVGPRQVRACYSGSPDLSGTANLIRFGGNGEVSVTRVAL